MIFLIFPTSKTSKNLYFWPIFVKITAHGQSFQPREAYNSAKWPQYNPFEVGEKNFKISPPPPNQKSIFWAQKWQKMTEKIEKFSKIVLVGIDLELSKTYSKTKISILKIFPIKIVFQWHSHFFRKMIIIGYLVSTHRLVNVHVYMMA